ncbi:MAG: anthranilate synthase component I family protein [Crocinitomicaceae bacterium]|nr:anthranilate synthase component I family protein [Crocinitomicaceae bacterium]
MKQQYIVYYNSNSSSTNYLCFGRQDAIVLNNPIDFQQLQYFVDQYKGQFICAYLSYDFKNSIEKLTSSNTDNLNFPEVVFFVPQTVVELTENRMQYIQGEDSFESRAFVDEFLNTVNSENSKKTFNFRPRISREAYISSVNQLKQHIQRGDIYEINFCQEFYDDKAVIDNPLSVYATVNQITQAPFSVYFHYDEWFAFCGSPERFIQRKGTKISSQPIKGTAPRGKNEQEDLALKNALQNNPKERSENVMIVDLVRNDLSKIATNGSVKVDELFGVYSFNTVHQLISTISCEVETSTSFIDILKATFPMGSMTGAPKVSAMKLSEQAESFKRSLYSGTIGYILPNGDFDFNVVIRTLLYNSDKNYLSCGVGGAITIKSDAAMEYDECETKVRKLLDAFR